MTKDKEEKKEEKLPTPSLFRLFSFARSFDFFLILVGIIAAAGAGTILPLFVVLFGNAVDAFQSPDMNKLYNEIVRLAYLIVSLGAAGFVTNAVSRFSWTYTSERQIEAIRIAYLKAILRQEISYFDKTGTGTLTNQIVVNTLHIQEAIGEKLGQLVLYTSTFISGIVIGFTCNWKLAFVVLSTLPILVSVVTAATMMFMKAEEVAEKAYAEAGSVANETIGGIRTIHSLNLQAISMEKYSARIAQAMKAGIRKGKFSGSAIGAIYLVMFGSYALTFWYGGKLLSEGRVSSGDILVVVLAIFMASFVLGQAASSLEAISSGLSSAAPLFNLLDRAPMIDSSSLDGTKLDQISGNLSLKNAHFRYPTRPDQKILDGLTLDIPAGSKIAIVGPSGSGKSSIIQLLQRFYDLEEGVVSLDGHDVKGLNLSWFRSQLGVVGQEPTLFSGTIRDNISFGCQYTVTQEDIETASKAALAHSFIMTFPEGYDTQVGERGAQLSGGQKQRIAIARAILKNPKILLLDEATSALDSRSEKKVQQALDNAAIGRTTIVVAHRLSTIKNADRIAVISKGVVAEIGTHQELISLNGIYTNLVRIQMGGESLQTSMEVDVGNEKEFDEDNLEIIVEKEAIAAEEQEIQKKFSMRQIISMNRPELLHIITGALGASIIGIVYPIQSIIFGHIFAAYQSEPNKIIDDARPWLLGYVGLAVVLQLGHSCQGYFFGYAGQKLVYRCRFESFKSILKQEIGWFDRKENSTGTLTGKLSSEAAQIEGAVGTPIGAIITCCVAVVTGFIIAYIHSARYAWVVTLAFPLILFGGFMDIYSSIADDTEKRGALLAANTVATEAISNMRTVASYVNESKMVEKYAVELLKPKAKSLVRALRLGGLIGLGQFSVMGVNALAFWYGGKLLRDGDINFKDFLTCYQAFMFSSEIVSVTLNLSSNVTKARSAATSLFSLINRVSKIDSLSDSGKTISSATTSGKITFEGVHFSYPTRPDTKILRGLDLIIKPNCVTAIVGASGCGKSSCIGLIERWYHPIQGSVKLDGLDLRDYNIQDLRKVISLVGQEPVLFSGSIADNISYSVKDATMSDIEEAARNAFAHDFISQFPDGYRTQVGEKGAQLSGGQKQRIAIARAIIRKPTVLLLDEATSALDTESEEVVQNALDHVMRGLTTIVIAHRLSTIRRADHIAVIDEGVVAEQGTHEDLMARRGTYFRLVQEQAGVP